MSPDDDSQRCLNPIPRRRSRLRAYRDCDGQVGAVEQDHPALQVVLVELPHSLPLPARRGPGRGRRGPSPRRRRSPLGARRPQVAVALEGARLLVPSRLVPLREESQHRGRGSRAAVLSVLASIIFYLGRTRTGS